MNLKGRVLGIVRSKGIMEFYVENFNSFSFPKSILLICPDALFLKKINVLRERQSVSRGGAEGEGDSESEAGSRLWAVSTKPDAELEPMNSEIMT